jgi:hypothetical protein
MCLVGQGLLWSLKGYHKQTMRKLEKDANDMPDGVR